MFYKVVRPFLLASAENWKAYVEFSGLSQLKDFCSLDDSLNPSVFQPETPEDWENCLSKNNLTHLITNFEYAQKMQEKNPGSRLFGVIIAPDGEEKIGHEKRLGYDIMDSYACNSLLTAFDDSESNKVFDRSRINPFALLNDLNEAYSIQDRFRELALERDDTRAEVWAVYQVE